MPMIERRDISSRFAELLCLGGWSPERRADPAHWIAVLEREGFKSHPAAVAILESLGGLSVPLPAAGINPYDHMLRFDPVEAASGEADLAEGWGADLGVELFPLGEEVMTGGILWAASNGWIYLGRGFGLYFVGESFGPAMDQLAFMPSPLQLAAG